MSDVIYIYIYRREVSVWWVDYVRKVLGILIIGERSAI